MSRQSHAALTQSSAAQTAKADSLVPPSRSAGKPSMGNQAVQRLLRDGAIQARLTVSQPGDPLEQEAERIARVMAGVPGPDFMNEPVIAGNRGGHVQRMCSKCEEEIHRTPEGSTGDTADSLQERLLNGLGAHGQPLLDAERDYFEPRFGHDFREVRIHTGAAAAAAAQSIGAQAYTRGRDIVFDTGKYQPRSSSGRHLLAHELVHVVQQRGENRVASHAAPAQVIQRACGAADIGTPAGCAPDASEPIGDLALFRFNCDEFASATERAKVVDFADSMESGDRVRVHGFASTDGNAAFNHKLSCARALAATAVLNGNGILPGQIDVLEHGPTPGPAAGRRSVVLERVPGVSRTVVPQLQIASAGPVPGLCGAMNFVSTWSLSRNAHATNGGFIVQDLTIDRDVVDCTGAAVPSTDPRPTHLRYFEAWRVAPGTTIITPAPTDTFRASGAPPVGGGCTDGSISFTGTARFHDNVAALPAHMVTPNAATYAGLLQSSLADPALGGNVSRSVAHELSFHWTCCPCSSSPTIVDTHTP
jgi:hypothetical protein